MMIKALGKSVNVNFVILVVGRGIVWNFSDNFVLQLSVFSLIVQCSVDHLSSNHGLINYKDTKKQMSSSKKIDL
jgi:hypothetical protein